MNNSEKKQDRFFPDMRKNRFSERLRVAMKGLSNLAFAKMCDINETTIRNYLADKTTPTLTVLEKIAAASGAPFVWLASGDPIYTDEGQNPTRPRAGQEKISCGGPKRALPMYELEAAAGAGTYISEENISDYWEVPTSWLRQERLDHAELVIINTIGDSMAPTFSSGAKLLVKLNINRNKALEGVFVINLDGHLRVKRLEASMFPHGYRIMSDNELHPSEFVPAHEIGERLKIIGEVVRIMASRVPELVDIKGSLPGKPHSPSHRLVA